MSFAASTSRSAYASNSISRLAPSVRSRAIPNAWPPAWLLPSARHLSTSPPTSRPRPRSSSSSSDPSASTSTSTSSKVRADSKSEFAFPSHLANPTPYDIFHFSDRKVSAAQVKARYYDLVRALHPDRLSHSPHRSSKSKASAEDDFKRVVSAYNLLKDPKKKHLYDRAGLGWDSPLPPSSSSADPWQDLRYTRRYNPSYTGPGHDRFGWQNQGFYSNQYSSSSSAFSANAGWNGRGKYTSNGIFISSLFVLTWVLAGLQYSRLSLQSQKAIERADRSHLDAARSLNEAREVARSEQGRERWRAFRRRAREQKFIDEIADTQGHLPTPTPTPAAALLPSPAAKEETPPAYKESAYDIGHGGPSGKQAAQERFAKAQAAKAQT